MLVKTGCNSRKAVGMRKRQEGVRADRALGDFPEEITSVFNILHMYLEAAAGHKNTKPTKSWPLVCVLGGSDGPETGHTRSWAGPQVTRLPALGKARHGPSTNVLSKCCHLQTHLRETRLGNLLGKESFLLESPASCSGGLRGQVSWNQGEQHCLGLRRLHPGAGSLPPGRQPCPLLS